MILFPAIDILEGRAVRLLHGERDAVTDYGVPLERAKLWADAGAQFLHVVDLNGAFGGKSTIDKTVEQIAKLGVRVQSGGGLRTMQEIDSRISAGAARVVLGTACARDPALFHAAVQKYGDKIVAGIDAKKGKLALNGWTEHSDIDALAFGARMHDLGVRYAVFTDIGRDGALSGVNAEETARMADTGLSVIASGGIHDDFDLRCLRDKGVYGAILGRSIYEGTIDLKKAIEEYSHVE
ncbi:MAG: 1-(5-phosphoribosyl)-5-((5-phosphoribosylamino)methylideneamino)imidazole-4-carboxamide isomerase [Clostridia bacterium]|jgi:phosphoribosylformimino-5-aminoimidazole carboxamide ribotide isomerase|nr:1-(5-phosphoribosyl)-5-((5-phosphoribosylamino)methylideneamino)imidazole-4-carboxamide isomerase [Clostridia bacterium]